MKGRDYLYHKELGYLIILEESDGISSIILSDEIPKFKIIKSDEVEKCKEQLKEYLEGKRKIFDLKLDIKGSEFRKKAWNELRKIPYGEKITYQEQATRIGKPEAARAVGQANGDNPILIVIPCHRVIGKSGKLTGYSSCGGIKTKEFLLKLEEENYETN